MNRLEEDQEYFPPRWAIRGHDGCYQTEWEGVIWPSNKKSPQVAVRLTWKPTRKEVFVMLMTVLTIYAAVL
jgi:hypothetical protein